MSAYIDFSSLDYDSVSYPGFSKRLNQLKTLSGFSDHGSIAVLASHLKFSHSAMRKYLITDIPPKPGRLVQIVSFLLGQIEASTPNKNKQIAHVISWLYVGGEKTIAGVLKESCRRVVVFEN